MRGNIKNKHKNNFWMNLIIIASFILLTFIFMQTFLNVKIFNVVSDSSFHLSRANEIYQNLKNGTLFTFIATHTFNHSGVGTFLFYPSFFLYPMAFFRMIFNPITAIYLWVGMFILLTMIVAFYSMMSFSHNRKRSYLFALIYTLAPYHLYLGLWNGVWGEYVAYTFLPLVFLGIYHVLWKDQTKWPILAIGMTLLCYSHIISIYIVTFICLVLFICKVIGGKLSKQRFLNLFKSAGLTVILSGWQFIPFLTDYLGGNIQAPKAQFWFLNSFSVLVDASFNNICGSGVNNGRSLGILLIIILFTGWIFVKKCPKELSIYTLGAILALMSTTFIDWNSLTHNEMVMNTLGNIQFPFRLLPYAGLFLSITASFVINDLIDSVTSSNYRQGLIVIGFVLISICGYFGTVQPAIDRITKNVSARYLRPSTATNQRVSDDVVLDKNNYSNLFSYLPQTGGTDYFPKKAYKHSDSILKQIVYLNGKEDKDAQIKYLPNQEKFSVNATEDSKIDLPIIAYRQTKAYNNGKPVNYQVSQRGTVQIDAQNGKNEIQVRYQPSKFYDVMFIIAVVGWTGVAWIWIKKAIKSN